MTLCLWRLSFLYCLFTVVCRADTPAEIYQKTGVKGGLVVHWNCGDGGLTTSLRVNGSYVVHGLDADASNIAKARKRIRSTDLGGKVTAEQWTKKTLPYASNLVQLFVGEYKGNIPMAEIVRVLSPNGVAYLKKNGSWQLTRKPRPATLGEWTHYLHGPDNNAVTPDTAVDAPKHVQWYAGPKHMRSHDHLSSLSALTAEGGRIFYIVDEGPIGAVGYPSKWKLIARDAFSGVLLWKRPMSKWEDQFRGFRSGPPEIGRRLVSVGGKVYVTLGYGEPVSVLDGATGKTVRTCEGTADTREFIISGNVLLAVAAKPWPTPKKIPGKFHFWPFMQTTGSPTRLVAVDVRNGKKLWAKSDGFATEIMPAALAASAGKLYVQTTRHLVCADVNTGKELWRADRPIPVVREAWSTPTLVVKDGVVISADRVPPKSNNPDGKLTWTITSSGGKSPAGKMIAFDAVTGKELWSANCKEGYNSAADIFVIRGLVWSGDVTSARGPGFTAALDLTTGKIRQKRDKDQTAFKLRMCHHRCYRNRATTRYLLLGRCGIEFLDTRTGKITPHDWVRGACQYGIMPANGLIYSPPHPCACLIESKLTGFYALAHAGPGLTPDTDYLEKGPAFSQPNTNTPNIGDWPTLRCNNERNGRTTSQAPAKLSTKWRTEIGGRLTAVTIAAGKVFVAQKDRHVLYALDEGSGKPAWTFTTGGRIDSPPTIWKGLVLFGSHDGYVYCLRSGDGQLVWRYRAGPTACRIVVESQLESTWPVSGSVLVQANTVWFAAGRSSHIDGGMILCGLDPTTGEQKVRKVINDEVGDWQKSGALEGVLTSDGTSLFLRHNRFSFKGERQPTNVPHIYCSAGLLDDTWWHRTYWQYGTSMGNGVGWGGWARAAQSVPSGRILVADDKNVYGYGRRITANGVHIAAVVPNQIFKVGSNAAFHLFAQPKARPRQAPAAKGKKKGRRKPPQKKKLLWTSPTKLHVRGLALAADTLVLAGCPDVATRVEGAASFRGKSGGRLILASKSDGKLGKSMKLTSPPVFDGLAVAGGRVYIAQFDGTLVCIE